MLQYGYKKNSKSTQHVYEVSLTLQTFYSKLLLESKMFSVFFNLLTVASVEPVINFPSEIVLLLRTDSTYAML